MVNLWNVNMCPVLLLGTIYNTGLPMDLCKVDGIQGSMNTLEENSVAPPQRRWILGKKMVYHKSFFIDLGWLLLEDKSSSKCNI